MWKGKKGKKHSPQPWKVESLFPLLAIHEAYFKLQRQIETVHFWTHTKLRIEASQSVIGAKRRIRISVVILEA